MKYASASGRILAVSMIAAAGVAGACSRADRSDNAGATARAGANGGKKYPAPRWPSYFKPPKSVDDLMPAARLLVRNQSGLRGKGMGILQPGGSVVNGASNGAHPMGIDATSPTLPHARVHPALKPPYRRLGET